MPATTKALVLTFPGYRIQGEALAAALSVPSAQVHIHRFPDGESKVTLPPELPKQVVFCRSLDHPNDKLVELLLAARAARDTGAESLVLVAPYLCYMRQDIAFSPGEVVSQKWIGEFLAGLFDVLITVDPHLHRVTHLRQAIPMAQAETLSAQSLLADYCLREYQNPLLLGPDEESRQWVAVMAQQHGFEYAVARKRRLSDTEVVIELPQLPSGERYQGRHVVLVDDVISSGHTLAEIARLLQAEGVGSIDSVVTHALFAPGADNLLYQSGIRSVVSTDSITHTSNRIALTALLADATRKYIAVKT